VNLLIAVTTCPRPDGASYVEQTLASLAPWKPLVLNDRELRGARWNTWVALHASRYYDRLLLLQDDVIAEPNLIDVAQTLDIPDDVGIVNLHDFGDDFDWAPPPPGLHKFAAHRFGSLGMCGAQALLIPVDHARWLGEQDMNGCPAPGPHKADYALGWWTARSKRPCKLIVSPALVTHIGERSACHDKERREAGTGIPHAGRTIEDLQRIESDAALSPYRS
jgi:hypothetical protein